VELNKRARSEMLSDESDENFSVLTPDELDKDKKLPEERNSAEQALEQKKCVVCWCRNEAPPLDPLNVHLLLKFMNVEGRILPRRQTKLCAKFQRRVNRTIRRAKHLGLFSYKHGRFTVIDPFNENPTYEDMMNDMAREAWAKLYPLRPFPGLYETPTQAILPPREWDDDDVDDLDDLNFEDEKTPAQYQ
jgi:small subunit ribosomal protein S18